jgi:site-specific DNA-methyltransferase (adenine-specific)
MMEFHRLCELFPEMPEEEYQALKADIAEHGLKQPIWTFRGQILEGRARYRACRELGIEPQTREWPGDDGPELVAFVMSLNYHRRHLKPGQKALIATVAEEKFAEEAKRRAKELAAARAEARRAGQTAELHPNTKLNYKESSAWKAGELVGVNGIYVSAAKKIKAEAPDLAVKVKNGEMTIPQARVELRRVEKRRELDAKAAIYRERSEDPWRIVCGDSGKFLHSIHYPACGYPCRPGDFHLIFADPPYNIGVDYGDHYDDDADVAEYLEGFRMLAVGAAAALSESGAFVLLVNHELAWRLVPLALEAGFHLRQWLTWFESFGVNHARGFNRCSRPLLWFVKDRRRFTFNADAVNRLSDRQAKYGDGRADPGGKTWDDIWGINPPIPRLVGTATERMPDFPTQLPLALLRPIVGCFSDPGDLVLDPFSGSGTTGCACIELGRRYVGIELSETFVELSRKRLLVHSKEVIRHAGSQ